MFTLYRLEITCPFSIPRNDDGEKTNGVSLALGKYRSAKRTVNADTGSPHPPHHTKNETTSSFLKLHIPA